MNKEEFIEAVIPSFLEKRRKCNSAMMYGYYSGIIDLLYKIADFKDVIEVYNVRNENMSELQETF